ncbi:uncharacterized protein LOC128866593 [Anastrepha ludens]|uniref:uncharacterized protein LOC128866593 n=1 Tax=Anastrepha ludens TaxID=28586 RepID=UPI0023AE6D5F|nr:uncharacterized protein LOC128866593 [Anastrepha ludens]
MSFKKDLSKVEYRIKLLSGNNVVLIEANGFESEIFVPEIQGGRISFQNIIPNRRCCNMLNASKILLPKKRRPTQSPEQLSRPAEHHGNSISPSRTWRLQAGDGNNSARSPPLAFSTPAPAPSPTTSFMLRQQSKCADKENFMPRQRSLAQAYQTFEMLRTNRSSSIQLDRKSPLPKTVSIQCKDSEIDKRINAAIGDSGFNIPDVPNLTPSRASPKFESPNVTKNKTPIPYLGTVTKWRKCLTPVRTYSRHGINVPRRPSSSSVKKARYSKRVASTTQGTKGSYQIEVRRRKLILDDKTAISPHTFKQQQQPRLHLRSKSPARGRSGAALPKSRKQYDFNVKTAFDQLILPSRSRNMSTKLIKQFKKACVNKASSTCPKYKILCKVPPLEHPKQVRDRQRQDNSKVNKSNDLRACNITTASMMEKALSKSIKTFEHLKHLPRV